ncbi:hypothetical protein CAPTEDRAFT_189988 [Capitella teleta]|uniref:MalT-like TPR region domain-containing protein n=1 Tax=Capitella teleta TaxID=283909 RepID=R7UZU6_CAPTE|nr:hypothetical protein CAPTEDRAFT_189988 [Capitella teleta]|eukprot:ELU11814.1 hypothetical protein CAPTEDRAFT_189988 [Capitella teleta]
MSSYNYPSGEFWSPVMTLWFKAQAARTNKHFDLMKSLIEGMVVHCKQSSAMKITDGVRFAVSSVLLLAGKDCNTCMASYLAIECFFCAIEILAKAIRCERSSQIMSDAFEGLVHTNLQNNDLESARILLDDWNGRAFTSDHPDVTLAIGKGNMELGLAFMEKRQYKEALDYLTPAVRKVLRKHDPEFRDSESEGIFASALGNCLYMESGAVSAFDTVRQARLIWKSLNWPFEHVDCIVGCLGIHMECLLWMDEPCEEYEVHSDMLMQHSALVKLGKEMLVPEMFTSVGMVALDNKQEEKAAELFEQACTLYKLIIETKESEEICAEIRGLLMHIGHANFQTLHYGKAASAYMECLPLLEKRQPAEEVRLASCVASLGLTYSVLFDYDNMMLYCERAFRIDALLSPNVRQLIIVSMGHLYYVKAVKLERDGQEELSSTYHVKALAAFQKALDEYPSNAAPSINYGYYLFHQGNYYDASAILCHAYQTVRSHTFKDTIEYTCMDEPILIEDLRNELRLRQLIRIPSTVFALYLKTLAQVKMGNASGAQDTVDVLQREVYKCRFADYYCCAVFGQDSMRRLAKSLLRFALRAAGKGNH